MEHIQRYSNRSFKLVDFRFHINVINDCCILFRFISKFFFRELIIFILPKSSYSYNNTSITLKSPIFLRSVWNKSSDYPQLKTQFGNIKHQNIKCTSYKTKKENTVYDGEMDFKKITTFKYKLELYLGANNIVDTSHLIIEPCGILKTTSPSVSTKKVLLLWPFISVTCILKLLL